MQPYAPCTIRQKRFFLKSVRLCEIKCTLPHEQYMITAGHHQLSNPGRIFNTSQCSDGPSPVGGTVHYCSVEFHIALFIRKSAESNREIVRIFFNEIDTCDHSVKRVVTIFRDLFHCQFSGMETVCTGYDDGFSIRFF